jgi:ABC-2 type transport system ATP-binding protein
LRLFDRLSGAGLLRYVGLLRRVAPADIATRSTELLEALNLTEDRNTLVVEYSAGMTKKIGLACALISHGAISSPAGCRRGQPHSP